MEAAAAAAVGVLSAGSSKSCAIARSSELPSMQAHEACDTNQVES